MTNAPRYYRVRPGDTLHGIAEKLYGDKRLGVIIYNHNRHYIENPNQLHPGQTIVIPHIRVDETVFQ